MTMPYADTDFYLALIKDKDWLSGPARKLYQEHKGNITTSAATIIELLLICDEFGIDHERLVECVFGITTYVIGIEPETALEAAHYIKEKRLTTFDALHAAYCGDLQIISSDHKFDAIGMKRIRLEK